MKKKPTSKQLIAIVLAAIVLGTIVLHRNIRVSHIVTLAIIGSYILYSLPAIIKGMVHFKKADSLTKMRNITWLIFVYILVRGIVGGTIPYFLLLLNFGLEYIIYDSREKRNE